MDNNGRQLCYSAGVMVLSKEHPHVMGLVGWSVVVPTLLGAALGIWLDNHHPGKHPCTLALLVVGLAVGCLNAWHWVAKEDRAMRDAQEDSDG